MMTMTVDEALADLLPEADTDIAVAEMLDELAKNIARVRDEPFDIIRKRVQMLYEDNEIGAVLGHDEAGKRMVRLMVNKDVFGDG